MLQKSPFRKEEKDELSNLAVLYRIRMNCQRKDEDLANVLTSNPLSTGLSLVRSLASFSTNILLKILNRIPSMTTFAAENATISTYSKKITGTSTKLKLASRNGSGKQHPERNHQAAVDG